MRIVGKTHVKDTTGRARRAVPLDAGGDEKTQPQTLKSDIAARERHGT
jgi:hypothetical protein